MKIKHKLSKLTTLAAVLLSTTCIFCNIPILAQPKPNQIQTIRKTALFPEIVGNQEFIQKTTAALQLLQLYAPKDLRFIRQYVGRIKQAEKSGMVAYVNPPTFELSAVSMVSKTWTASIIAHDAYHSYLYQYYLRQYKPRGMKVPYDLWGGFEAERKCIKYQMGVLKKVRGPAHEIEHLSKQDGTHGDVNKDGVLDWRDYELRNW
ncbi:hypothetical protein H6F32_08680 [Anabaena sp. FACHB-1237]|uniref:hypothetical protein n=1 Tax=Anabaena sp. FACHB-1237 TaxID=2692769 RepID=UPI0016803517|nr:hypothetical protein [Anabaena sp. FACHB-1237]MBD2137658.1 hypothetical protein [Anabaena sp. FACHB-1237]